MLITYLWDLTTRTITQYFGFSLGFQIDGYHFSTAYNMLFILVITGISEIIYPIIPKRHINRDKTIGNVSV